MNFKGKDAYFVYVTAFEMRFDVAQIMIIFQIIVFLFAGIGMLKIFKQGKIEHILLPMIFLGGFVFHTFWETKAIYVLQYYYLLLPYAAFGIFQLFEKIERVRK